ncbi:hypothetical protein LIA77_04271 [Sarocladium implicatum]|nr:hypothetical protein LIA77_04271 [Sarocladium implicatum]
MADHDCFVYVGQSTDICLRIRAHESPFYRAKNVLLHYYLWDSQPDLQSAFVVLADAPSIQAIDLNILELWACLIFQSLLKHEIEQYASSSFRRIARGLNVANPLWQGVPEINQNSPLQLLSKTEHFTGLIRQSNPIRKQYLLDASRWFSEIRISPNETLRRYFQELCWRRQEEGSRTKTSQTLQSLLRGCKKAAKAYGNSTSLIVLGSINLRVLRREIRLKDTTTVFIQGFVSNRAVPGWYALEAGPNDAAQRLRLWVEGTDENGQHFGQFIHAGGDRMVQDMNTLVDQLDGVRNEEIAKRPRRRIPSSVSKGRFSGNAYT